MPPVAPRTTQPRTITAQPFAAPAMPARPQPPAVPSLAPTPLSSAVIPPAAPPPPVAPQPPVAAQPAAPARVTAPVPVVTPASGAPKRAPNPFLANDPNQKAKRLARALVSDMVAYLPQKREEGLKNNTLKQLFREEIKKSYEEFVEQIGKEFAESTTHFQDALNDVLAGGKKIF
jgi:hypothetical protein